MYDVNRLYGRADHSETAVYSARRRRAPVNSDRDRRTDPRRPRPRCIRVLRTLTHTPHRTGWHASRRFKLFRGRTGSSVLRCRSQAAGDPHGGLGGRSEIATPNRPFLHGGTLPLTLWTAPHDNRTRSSEAYSSASLDYQKTTVKTTSEPTQQQQTRTFSVRSSKPCALPASAPRGGGSSSQHGFGGSSVYNPVLAVLANRSDAVPQVELHGGERVYCIVLCSSTRFSVGYVAAASVWIRDGNFFFVFGELGNPPPTQH